MLHYSVVFLVIALIAAVFGFGGIAAGAVEIAKILFFIFAIMAVISFVVGLMKGPHEKPAFQPFPRPRHRVEHASPLRADAVRCRESHGQHAQSGE